MRSNGRIKNALRIGSLVLAALAVPALSAAQQDIRTDADGVVRIARGSSAIITRPDSVVSISYADPQIIEVVVQSDFPNQIVVNALNVGTTSLSIWDRFGRASMLNVEVTADVAAVQRQLDQLFPDVGLTVESNGSFIVLSGQIRDPQVERKAMEIVGSLGLQVINNLQAPPREQILLHVEFAEISRSVLKELGTDLIRVINPSVVDHAFDSPETGDRLLSTNAQTQQIEAASEGFITVALQDDRSALEGVIRVLKNSGEFRSLAQPNLVTREGQEASFLAGGEFPFPTLQGGGNNNAVTIVWKEFGIRLNFTPYVTNSGTIQLAVEPEVSSLDFANGLTFQGFNIPSILARRVSTDVELAAGQTLAIGGLMDNTMLTEVDKIPILGDIPILGFFFKSKGARENRTELLVLVTPYILDSDNLPAPPVPTGEALDWEWDGHIGKWLRARADSAAVGSAN